jgi:hypothetical protein
MGMGSADHNRRRLPPKPRAQLHPHGPFKPMRAAKAFLLLTLPLTLLSACGLRSKELSGTAYLAISVDGEQPLT